jgi:hypothetical protein
VIVGAVRSQDVQSLSAPADADLEALSRQQPAAEQHFQAVQRMHAVEEIATPALSLCALLVLVVLLEEGLLLVGIGLEEEAADLMKGAAQAMQQFAHAAWGEPSTEGFLDPVARLGGRVEAPGGDLALECQRALKTSHRWALENQPL